MIIITPPPPNSLLHGFQNEQNSPRPRSRLLGLKRDLVSKTFLRSLFSLFQGELTLKCVRTAGWEGIWPVQRYISDQADTTSGSELCCWMWGDGVSSEGQAGPRAGGAITQWVFWLVPGLRGGADIEPPLAGCCGLALGLCHLFLLWNQSPHILVLSWKPLCPPLSK